MDGVRWMDQGRFEVGGTKFVAAGLRAVGAREEGFVVDKRPELVRKYFRLFADECPRRIVELGVERGGSTALIALLAEPDLLLAVDVAPEVPAQLAEFIERKGLTRSIVTAFGIDQSDAPTIRDLVELHIAAEPVDLIIDDASHVLGSTRTSFEVLFPRLRPGGLYVIEDWASDCAVAAGLHDEMQTWASFDDRFETVRDLHPSDGQTAGTRRPRRSGRADHRSDAPRMELDDLHHRQHVHRMSRVRSRSRGELLGSRTARRRSRSLTTARRPCDRADDDLLLAPRRRERGSPRTGLADCSARRWCRFA